MAVCLVNLALAIFFSYAMEAGMRSPDTSFVQNLYNSKDMLGPVSSVGGMVDLIIAIFVLAYKNNRYGIGFLLSAVLLLLMGWLANNYYL